MKARLWQAITGCEPAIADILASGIGCPSFAERRHSYAIFLRERNKSRKDMIAARAFWLPDLPIRVIKGELRMHLFHYWPTIDPRLP
jgi:hypothetical protein